ncbi:MAG: hypothetical protein M3Z96_10545 [Pseudomonadota bacterium]|nr:hypothetical protein [Pseudomonadota bacterium]
MKEAFDHTAKHARRFGEFMAIFPAEITKTYQDAQFKSVNAAVQPTEKAGLTAADNADRISGAVRKSSSVCEHREST